MIDALLDAITGLPAPALCAVVGMLALLETAAFAGLAVPGETAVVFGGVLAFQGHAPLAAMAASAVVGAIAGDSLGFYFGRRFGTRLLAGRVGRIMGRERVASTMSRLRAGGIKAIVLGRFIGVLRAVMPFAAGTSGMSYPRFLTGSVIGATAWGIGFTIAGYAAGNSWRRVESYAGRASTAIAVALVTIVLVVLAGKLAAKRQDRIRAWVARTLARPRIAAVRQRYRREIGFLLRRFTPGSAAGLQLTLALFGLAVLGYLTALVAAQVYTASGLQEIDARIVSGIEDAPLSLLDVLDVVHRMLSPVGAAVVAVSVGLAVWVRERRKRPLVTLVLAVGGAVVLAESLRRLLTRPPVQLAERLFERSFPAPATTAVAATVLVLLAVLLPRIGRWTRKVLACSLAVGVVVAAGFAELFAAAVYFSDVVGGSALGALWGLAVATVVATIAAPRESRIADHAG